MAKIVKSQKHNIYLLIITFVHMNCLFYYDLHVNMNYHAAGLEKN